MSLEQLIVSLLFFLVRLNILKSERYKMDINPIVPVYWVSNTEVFVNEDSRSFLYDVVSREIIEEFDRGENQVHGFIDGELVVCEWENVEIDSPEEFSTHLIQKNMEGDIKLDIELRPTTSVVECSDEIILVTVPPIKEKIFMFDNGLFEVEEYSEDMLSPSLRFLVSRDALGSYWITNFGFNS